jgi:hypothetical protein
MNSKNSILHFFQFIIFVGIQVVLLMNVALFNIAFCYIYVAFLLMLPICVIGTHGCQWLGRMDQTRAFETARADHAACTEGGYTWPGDAYTDCRRIRADARQRQQFWDLAGSTAALSDGVLRRHEERLRGDFSLGQDDVSWEAHWNGTDSASTR